MMMTASESRAGVHSTASSLPFAILELVASFCSPAAAASARLVCLAWRCTFGVAQEGLRLDSQRPTREAAALLGAHAFPLARRATLVLAAAPVEGSQAQVDAWLHALRQRTAITHLTLSSATDPLAERPSLAADRLPAQRLLTSLAHLSSLHHLRDLTLDLTPAWCEAACAAVGQLTLLTRLQAATLRGDRAAQGLAGSLRGGMPHLRVLDLSFGAFLDTPALFKFTEEWAQPVLEAAAAGCPHLSILLCSGHLEPTCMMAAVASAAAIASSAATAASAASTVAAATAGAASGAATTTTAASTTATTSATSSTTTGAGAVATAAEPSSLAASVNVTCTSLGSHVDGYCTEEGVTALRGACGVATTATLHVVATELSNAGLGDPVGSTFSIIDAALCDARHLLRRLTLPPLTTALEGVTYVLRHRRKGHFLDLSLLPPTLTSFRARIRKVEDWPRISGSAPSLTALELSWRFQGASMMQGAALAALAAGCTNLRSLTLFCNKPPAAAAAVAWAPLAALQRLTHLSFSGATEDAPPDAAFCTAWLPPSLVSLKLFCVMVAATGPLPRLPQLLSVHLHCCRVEDLRMFDQAHSLRRLTAVDTGFDAGCEALLGFAELEELWETDTHGQERLVQAAAAAAAAALLPGGGVTTGALLPRLRFLGLSDRAVTDAVHQLLLRLPHLHTLRLAATLRDAGGVAAMVLSLQPLGRLTDLTLLEVCALGSGKRGALVKQLQAALPHLVVVAAAEDAHFVSVNDSPGGMGPAWDDLQPVGCGNMFREPDYESHWGPPGSTDDD